MIQTVVETATCIKPKGKLYLTMYTLDIHRERTIINDFSTVVEPGQKVAIVGPTGAGKTTIVKLLMQFSMM